MQINIEDAEDTKAFEEAQKALHSDTSVEELESILHRVKGKGTYEEKFYKHFYAISLLQKYDEIKESLEVDRLAKLVDDEGAVVVASKGQPVVEETEKIMLRIIYSAKEKTKIKSIQERYNWNLQNKVSAIGFKDSNDLKELVLEGGIECSIVDLKNLFGDLGSTNARIESENYSQNIQFINDKLIEDVFACKSVTLYIRS